MRKTLWENELDRVQTLLKEGNTLEQIGKSYGVTKQRMYQVLTKFGIATGQRKCKNFLKDKEPKYYWLNRILATKKIPKEERLILLDSMLLPDFCPIFNIKLNYNGNGMEGGWSRTDDSPSLDRIDSTKGYTKDNIQVISWRANRIKNDSTPEELLLLAEYMLRLTKKDLQV
jgi:hypothetical protein